MNVDVIFLIFIRKVLVKEFSIKDYITSVFGRKN